MERLRRVDWQSRGVVYAVLFGSGARGCRFSDIDVAVLFRSKPGLDELLDLVSDIADAVGVSDDMVDLVVLNREDLPCVLVVEALGRGVPVYYESIDMYLDDVLRRLWVCWDFEISYRRLGVLEAASRVVKSSWGR